MKVRVKAPFQVNHDGKNYSDGDEVEVPDPDARQLVRSGLVEEVKDKPAKKAAVKKQPEPVKQGSAQHKKQSEPDK